MSVIGEILAEARERGYINFGPGLPDHRLFPVEEIKEALSDFSAADLNYTPYEGLPELREALTRFLERRGIRDRSVIVTFGAQDAIALVALFLRKRGMGLRVGNPSYLEALNAFRGHGVSVSPADIDERGEIPDIADAYYTIPTGHNPTGVSMDLSRREEFASLSERVLIIEDGTYDMLYYDRELPPIASLT
ncbi:MAG: aminotransferase class I/II-fold pyridoxal phosphate-dependent enzyme, partial [Candidatus Diapherotrites archaeon]|nr:aminotransferase class I/II-fold pyridoxal phosphate-dependent enzyme [Candidatus Diapherotrites archaeon]